MESGGVCTIGALCRVESSHLENTNTFMSGNIIPLYYNQRKFEQKRNFKEEYNVVKVKEEHVSYSDEMEDYSNFESSSTDVPGNYPEVLMTEGKVIY